jgi:hypothetical protein
VDRDTALLRKQLARAFETVNRDKALIDKLALDAYARGVCGRSLGTLTDRDAAVHAVLLELARAYARAVVDAALREQQAEQAELNGPK